MNQKTLCAISLTYYYFRALQIFFLDIQNSDFLVKTSMLSNTHVSLKMFEFQTCRQAGKIQTKLEQTNMFLQAHDKSLF